MNEQERKDEALKLVEELGKARAKAKRQAIAFFNNPPPEPPLPKARWQQ